LHSIPTARRIRTPIGSLLGAVALLLAIPATGLAAESNPNQYACLGHLKAGTPEPGNEEQQVQYSFYCNGPITGYQLESQVQLTGVGGAPVLTAIPDGKALTDTFSCSGETPGWAVNCVGLAKGGYETVTGQFSIGTKLCAEPRVDPLLTVMYAYLEKGAVVQAISGPFDLGRPEGCRPDGFSGSTRLNPKPPARHHGGKHGKGKKHGKRARHARRAAHRA
jgi:hypothetical protein